MIVSLQEFNTYSGNNESSLTESAQKTTLLLSAEHLVVEYLGYDPTVQDRSDIMSSYGGDRIYTRSRDIVSVASLYIDNNEISSNDYTVKADYILYKSLIPHGLNNIRISYRSGFAPDSREMALVKTTILRIATLMLQEAGGNIGLTGKSFADQSRTFLNYTNYDKYLQPLNSIACEEFE